MQMISGLRMTPGDVVAYDSLRERVGAEWAVISGLPFVADGELHAVFVGQRAGDERFYVFRAYSTSGRIEMASRHDDRAEAVEARFAACHGHADVVYDNRRETA